MLTTLAMWYVLVDLMFLILLLCAADNRRASVQLIRVVILAFAVTILVLGWQAGWRFV